MNKLRRILERMYPREWRINPFNKRFLVVRRAARARRLLIQEELRSQLDRKQASRTEDGGQRHEEESQMIVVVNGVEYDVHIAFEGDPPWESISVAGEPMTREQFESLSDAGKRELLEHQATIGRAVDSLKTYSDSD